MVSIYNKDDDNDDEDDDMSELDDLEKELFVKI
mgnify:CR=1 FL=1